MLQYYDSRPRPLSLRMAHSCASAVYAEQLVSRGYGLPLWRPEPANPMDEVEIGDVGYVSEGEFIRLFNAMRPADDPLNADGVPSGFVILQPSARLLRSDEHHLPPGPVCTTTTTYRQASGELEASSIVGASYTFTCKSSHGAVAVLGDSGHQKWYLRNVKFREYIVKHHASWYAFAIEREHDIAPGSLVLVSGWLKTSEWALATFANHGKTHDVSLSASAGSYASAAFTAAAGTEVAMSVEQRCGPQRTRTADGKLPRNQCLFLRYYKLKSRTFRRQKVSVRAEATDLQGSWNESISGGARSWLGSAGSWRSPFSGATQRSSGRLEPSDEDCEIYEAGDTSGGSMEIEEMPSVSDRTAAVDSVDIILDYLMEHSEASVAVACHEDLYQILQDGNAPHDQSLGSYNLQPPVHISLAQAMPAVSFDGDGSCHIQETPEPGVIPDRASRGAHAASMLPQRHDQWSERASGGDVQILPRQDTHLSTHAVGGRSSHTQPSRGLAVPQCSPTSHIVRPTHLRDAPGSTRTHIPSGGTHRHDQDGASTSGNRPERSATYEASPLAIHTMSQEYYRRDELRHTHNGAHLSRQNSGISVSRTTGPFASATAYSRKELMDERFDCQVCGKRFNSPSSLVIHIRTHTGEKPQSCPAPGCLRRFSTKSGLMHHMRMHHEDEGVPPTAVASLPDPSGSISHSEGMGRSSPVHDSGSNRAESSFNGDSAAMDSGASERHTPGLEEILVV